MRLLSCLTGADSISLFRRQRGRGDMVLDLKSGNAEFKSHSDHQLDWFNSLAALVRRQLVRGFDTFLNPYVVLKIGNLVIKKPHLRPVLPPSWNNGTP